MDTTALWNRYNAEYLCEALIFFLSFTFKLRPPRICWPFQADQPAAAAYLTESLRVAFELLEVRTSEHGVKLLLRDGRTPKGTRDAVGIEIREIIDACRGPKGEELRRNAQGFKAPFLQAWQKDGASRTDAQALLNKYKTRA